VQEKLQTIIHYHHPCTHTTTNFNGRPSL